MPHTTAPADMPMRERTKEEMGKPLTLEELRPILDMFGDLERKFNMLCSHLGIEITQNYEKFRIIDYRRGLNPNPNATKMVEQIAGDGALLKRPGLTKKWYQFWK